MQKVRFGIVGTGRISDWVLKGAVLDPRFEAAAVCSRTREKGEAFAARHGIGKVYTEIGRMAADPELDAIYIGTPNDTHCELALECMRRGKHVLCEKPLASNALEVSKMIQAAAANGVLLMEAMISTLTPNFRAAAQRLRTLGEPRHFFAAFCQYSSKYDLLKRILAGTDSSPVPSSFSPEHSGGALMDIGIYTIYPMVALFGAPSSVKADVCTCAVPVGSASKLIDLQGSVLVKADVCTCAVPVESASKLIDLQGSVLFGYPHMEACVMYSKIADSALPAEISCDDGILTLDAVHIARRAFLTQRGAPTSGRSSGPAAVDISVPVDADEYLCEFQEFIDTVLSGGRESSVNTLSTSLTVARIMDEVRRQAGVVFPADIREAH
jgi:scyllo-inositol 2-dehydrogenase (NADP+)